MPRVIAFGPSELHGLHSFPQSRGCDFCATGMPAWRYPARNIGLSTIAYGEIVLRPVSLGGWSACQGCSDLIEAGDWPALARRTLRSLDLDLSKAGPGTRVKLLGAFHQAHLQFRKACNGPRQAFAEDQAA
jgi:hypothetical protein